MGRCTDLDPPKSPLRRGVGGDFEKNLVPPLLRGSRGQAKGGSDSMQPHKKLVLEVV